MNRTLVHKYENIKFIYKNIKISIPYKNYYTCNFLPY